MPAFHSHCPSSDSLGWPAGTFGELLATAEDRLDSTPADWGSLTPEMSGVLVKGLPGGPASGLAIPPPHTHQLPSLSLSLSPTPTDNQVFRP